MNEIKQHLEDCVKELHTANSGKCSQEDVRKLSNLFMSIMLSPSESRQERLEGFQVELDGKYGVSYRLLFYRSVFLQLYVDNFVKISHQKFPKAIEDYVKEDFSRAIKIADSGNFKKLSVKEPRFLCYLEVLSFQRFPLGNQDVTVAGFSRSLLKGQSFSDGLKFSKTLLQCRGNSPLFELHFNPHRMRKFNPGGWEEVLRLAAELLLVRRDLKGVFGAAWFFDPALQNISPELNYLREIFLNAGGHLFFVGSSENDRKNAFAMSKARKNAYEEGCYNPASYLAILSRSALLKHFKFL